MVIVTVTITPGGNWPHYNRDVSAEWLQGNRENNTSIKLLLTALEHHHLGAISYFYWSKNTWRELSSLYQRKQQLLGVIVLFVTATTTP